MKKSVSLFIVLILLFSSFGVSASAASAPAKVTGVKVSDIKNDSAKLSWKAVSKATGYIIYKYISASDKFIKLTSVKKTAKTITGLKSSTKYKFCVCAYIKSDGNTYYGKKSELVSFSTKSSLSNEKVHNLYFKKLHALSKRASWGVQYYFSDMTGDGIHEMFVSYEDINTTGSCSNYKIYTYDGSKIKCILDDYDYGLSGLTVYPETKSFSAHFTGHGHESYVWYKIINGKYVNIAGKGRNSTLGGGDRDGAWNYYNELTASKYNALVNELKTGSKKIIHYSDLKTYSSY